MSGTGPNADVFIINNTGLDLRDVHEALIGAIRADGVLPAHLRDCLRLTPVQVGGATRWRVDLHDE